MKYDWHKLEREYTTGDCSLEELAEKHNINVTTVRKNSAKGRWTEKREQFRSLKGTKLNEKATIMAQRRYEKVQDTIDQAMNIALDRLLEFADVKNLKDAKLLMDTLKGAQEIVQGKDSFPKKIAELDAKIKKLQVEADAIDKAKDVIEGGLQVEFVNGEWMNEDTTSDAE